MNTENEKEYNYKDVKLKEKDEYNRYNAIRKYFTKLKIYLIIFIVFSLSVLVYQTVKIVIKKQNEQKLENIKSKEFVLDSMNVDNFSLYTAANDSNIKELKTKQEEIDSLLGEIQKNIGILSDSQIKVFEELKNNNKIINNAIEELKHQGKNDKENIINIKKELAETQDLIAKQIKNLEEKIIQNAKQNIVLDKTQTQNDNNKFNEEYVQDNLQKWIELPNSVQRIHLFDQVEETSLISQETNEKDDLTLQISSSISKGILVTAGSASVIGMGSQKDTPFLISLKEKILLANNKSLDMRKCLLIGSGIGDVVSESVEIRLVKLTCIFVDEKEKQWIAEGEVKGYITDENGSIGVKGELISKEGKLLRATFPLAFIQTGLDYLSRSASNTTILGSGYGSSDLSASLNSGLSTAGNTTLNQVATIYGQYARAMQPKISVKAGRVVSVIFYGGETILLKPYKDQNVESGYIKINPKNGETFFQKQNDRIEQFNLTPVIFKEEE